MPELPSEKPRPHPGKRARRSPPQSLSPSVPQSLFPLPDFAELGATSNFTFLGGASHPEELVEQAAALGYRAIAVTDRNTVAGIVRGHVAAQEIGFQFIVGTRLAFIEPAGLEVLVYPTDRVSYGRMCRLLTIGKRRAEKGQCHLQLHDLLEYQEGLLGIVVPPAVIDQPFIDTLDGLRRWFDDDRLSLAAGCVYRGDDRERLAQLGDLSEHVRVPLVATNHAQYHVPRRRALHDVVTCIREGCTLGTAGYRLNPNAEHHLKPSPEMSRLMAECPGSLQRSVEIAERASAFNLDQLRYEYPHEVCPPGRSSTSCGSSTSSTTRRSF
jgi:error-prone DNA polymerase